MRLLVLRIRRVLAVRQLLVDDRKIPIESFEYRSEAPASVMVLQDLSGSMEGQSLNLSREAVRFFLGKALQGDEFALATFASGDLSAAAISCGVNPP